MSKIYKPVDSLFNIDEKKIIFLAGSIELDTACRWQDMVCNLLQDVDDLAILNPRRDEWDNSWKCSIDNPVFKAQVKWELYGIELADDVLFCFDPNTKSPITLLELGLCTKKKDPSRVYVYCPDNFWRKGNVDIVCEEYGFTIIKQLLDIKNIYNGS